MGLTYRGKHSLRDFGMQTKITDLPIHHRKRRIMRKIYRTGTAA